METQLDEERSRWEEDLGRKRDEHVNGLRLASESGESRCMRGRLATELLLRQWQQGDADGLLASVLLGWSRVRSIATLLSQRRRSIRAGVLRFCEGDERAAAHVCLLDWRHRARAARTHREEVLERDAGIRRLHEGARTLLAREQGRLLEYARLLAGAEGPALALALLAAWRGLAAGARRAGGLRRLEGALGEQRRLGGLLAARRGHLAAAALRLLGDREGRCLALACLLRWAQAAAAARRGAASERARRALAGRHEGHLQRQAARQDRAALLTACFWELLRSARAQRQARERGASARRLEEAAGLLPRLREEREGLEEQLAAAYRRVDSVTESLQKELRTKEELATELREVYDKLRRQGAPARTAPAELRPDSASRTGSTSRPSSARSGIAGGP